MTPSTNPDELPRAAGEYRTLEFRIEALERCIADLHRVVAERTDLHGWADGPSPSAVPELSPTETGESPLSLRLEQLALRLGDQERRSAKIASLVEGHEEALRLLCLALKEIDDPYGMGASLDERLGLDEAISERDDEWNAS